MGFTFATVKKLLCSPSCSEQLPDVLKELGIRRPLIVTDKGVVNAGLVAPVTKALSALSVSVFDGVIADPPEEIVLSGVDAALEHNADGIVGLGGGSALDTAKIIALLANHQPDGLSQSLTDIYGVGQIRGQRLPLVLIPTTAGTGSEVTPVAIVTTGETTKAGIVSPVLLPDVALLDASLTTGLPAAITAATGIDAMVHALEAVTGIHLANPYSTMLSRQALILLSQNIEQACREPGNLKVRQAMLLGACLAGQAFANSPVGGVHALAYPLGGHFHIPHGLSNALVLPHVLRFNGKAADQAYREMADWMDLPAKAQSANSGGAELLANYFSNLSRSLGLPVMLRECGVNQSDIPVLARDAMLQTRLLQNNPVEIRLEDAEQIYREAW